MRGQLEIHEEHVSSEAVQVVLRGALAAVSVDRPRVMLTTFPGEPHSAPVLHRRPVAGVLALNSLVDIPPQIERWRHGSAGRH